MKLRHVPLALAASAALISCGGSRDPIEAGRAYFAAAASSRIQERPEAGSQALITDYEQERYLPTDTRLERRNLRLNAGLNP